MKNQKRLSLDAFKEKANSIPNEEVMKNVQGGSWSDCHGFWGAVGKAERLVRDIVIVTVVV